MSSLAAESWTWYGVTWVIVLARLISRRLLRGSWRKLQVDDALILFAMLTDTVLMIGMNIVANTSSNLIDPNNHDPLTPESIKERTFGSKMVLVVEQMQITTIWTVKCCLLVMYSRLTTSLWQNVIVKVAACYVAFGWVFMEIFYFGVWCRPFHDYWAVPTDNVQCTAATNHLITNAVLNISSDLLIISIPLPIVIAAQFPWKRKLILCGVFALGLFTILSAILNKYYSFTQPFGSMWTFWYIRESSTALITANLPFTWKLLQRVFNLRSFNGRSYDNSNLPSGRMPSGRMPSWRMHPTKGRRPNSMLDDDAELGGTESQEQINKCNTVPLKIYQHREVKIASHTLDPKDDDLFPPNQAAAKAARPCAKETSGGGGSDVESVSDRSTAEAITVCRGL